MSIKVIKSINEMHSFSSNAHKEGKKIGFVPTMGYLHNGHISLINKSNEICDVTVASIFVNPMQFGPFEDLSKYPRDFDRDLKLLDDNGCNVLFYPSVEEIYPKDYQTYVEVSKITKILEGAFRPTHFKGVTSIVSILFNCVKPDFAFFGQKDAQQAAIIKQMVRDLKMDITVQVEPIIREADGLALSSRNIFLSKEDRETALALYKSLAAGKDAIEAGERNSEKIIDKVTANIALYPTVKLDYFAIANEKTFDLAARLEKGNSYYLLIAARVGATRLIDNLLITL